MAVEGATGRVSFAPSTTWRRRSVCAPTS